MFYRGYVETKNKKCVEKFKGRTDFKTLEQVQNLPEYAGILAEDAILIDLDDSDQAEILMKIVEDRQINCKVIDTTRGKHFLFKRPDALNKCRTHCKLAVGLTADIKVGNVASYEVLKFDGEERFCEWDLDDSDSDIYDTVPKWLYPVNSREDFRSMEAGDGRNQALFNYILTLQTAEFTVEESRETIRLLNEYVLKDSLTSDELEVILRDDAFKKPIFYSAKGTFLFEKFSNYMKNVCNAVKINNQLHIYKDGIYVSGYREIERTMIKYIPNLKKTQRRECIDYMELIAEPVEPAAADYIAFRNGVLHMYYDKDKGQTIEELVQPSAELVLNNRINWDYNPNAYCKETDDTLNRIACDDKQIRLLLEECIGYCFYRRNELGKAFILTGDKSNGKSTFLDCIKAILGPENISALELKELGDRFSTAMIFGKLANISDDISDDFLQGNQVATFKKVVTGNRIKAERKGQDPFEFEPYVKLICSANDIPRMKDKTGAVLRRLVIIPFNATFTKGSEGYDPFIKYKLISQQSIEYLIRLGVEGLKRILENNGFTESEKVQTQINIYEEENNPILAFLNQLEEDEVVNEPTPDVYRRYTVFCAENCMQPMGSAAFTRQVCKRMNMKVVDKRVQGKKTRVYEKERLSSAD